MKQGEDMGGVRCDRKGWRYGGEDKGGEEAGI